MLYNIGVMITKNETETIELGKRFGEMLEKGTCVILKGDLAAGKTTFTKGIGQALHCKSIINSPTFTILKIHQGDIPLYHIDAYRLENNEYDLGLDEYLEDSVMVVEWPEYYERYLPDEYLIVEFKYLDDNTREITISEKNNKYKNIVEAFV